MDERDILNMRQACELLGLSRGTLLKHLHAGNLPGRKLGRVWLLSRRQLIEWVEQGSRKQHARRKPRP